MAQLVFSDTSNNQGILQLAEKYVLKNYGDITGNTALLQEFTAKVNIWNGRIQMDIFLSDGKWQYDDFNIGDMPIAKTNLNSGQQDYSVRTDDNSRQIWKVSRVDAKDSSGVFHQLKQIDQRQIIGGFEEYRSIDGQPVEFDWNGISLLLFPSPNYNSTGGLKIIFQREAKPFSATGADSQIPGFASAFHYLLALGPAYEYARENGLKNKNDLRQELEQGRKELKEYFASRNSQQKAGLRALQENTR